MVGVTADAARRELRDMSRDNDTWLVHLTRHSSCSVHAQVHLSEELSSAPCIRGGHAQSLIHPYAEAHELRKLLGTLYAINIYSSRVIEGL